MKYDYISRLISVNRLEDALHALNAAIGADADDADALLMRGKVYWRLGERSKAMSDYGRAAAIDPYGPAAVALEQARNIEAFFNPDLLNP